MHSQSSPQVLIVGAGPTGLELALELSRHGIHCRIIDKAAVATDKSKALAIHSRSLEVFDHMGIVEDFLTSGTELNGINLFADGKKLMHLSLDDLDSPYPFILSLPQCETERILTGRLGAYGVQIERSTELVDLKQSNDLVTATLKDSQGQEESLIVSYVVGCDGAHSTVRHAINLPFEGHQYPDLFWLADVDIECDLNWQEGHLFTGQKGLCAIFPFGNGRFRVIVDFSLDSGEMKTTTAIQNQNPTLEQIQSVVRERLPRELILTNPQWLAAFAIHIRSAPRYSVDRVFLAGDAAHIHSPAGGQGMNTGLQDSFNLAWKLALVLKGLASQELLESYNGERHAVGQAVLRVTDFLTKVNVTRSALVLELRNLIAPILASQEVVQERMRNVISELAVNYHKSPIVAENICSLMESKKFGHSQTQQPELAELFEFEKGPRAGERAPNAHLFERINGAPTTLFEIMRNTEHHLFLLAGVRVSPGVIGNLVEIGQSVIDRYAGCVKVHYVCTDELSYGQTYGQIRNADSFDGTCLLDPDFSLHHRYGAASECLYLIRPDGYIGYRSLPANKLKFHAFLERVFV